MDNESVKKLKRKQKVVDKKFQYSISLRAMLIPLITILLVSSVLIYFATENNDYIKKSNGHIKEIVASQQTMIEIFLQTPNLNDTRNNVISTGQKTFKKSISKLMLVKQNSKKIVRNSQLVLLFLILLTLIQTLVIFLLFINYTHKISGPLMVMSRELKKIRDGEQPNFRPLRKNDELKHFYEELKATIDYLKNKK